MISEKLNYRAKKNGYPAGSHFFVVGGMAGVLSTAQLTLRVKAKSSDDVSRKERAWFEQLSTLSNKIRSYL